jgi:AcrR family transcriptional regulator
MGRAAPLQPDERRADIMSATERLIVAQGGNVSTKAIAEACGIAEGTIFRVFPTKDAIIDAIFADAFDKEPPRTALAAIDPRNDLETRLVAVVVILQQRIRRIMALFAALGFRQYPSIPKLKPGMDPRWDGNKIAAVLAPDAAKLRLPVDESARLVMGMVMAFTNPMLFGQSESGPEAIADLILNGIARRDVVATEKEIQC